GQTPLEAIDHLGVIHRMWPVMDVATIAKVTGLMGSLPVFIADGHHRYETACNYREELAKQGPLDPQHPANFVLMMCIAMDDPGLLVLPTHRLFRGMPNWTSEDLADRLAGCFTMRMAGEGVDLAESLWDELDFRGDQTGLALYTRKDDRWIMA